MIQEKKTFLEREIENNREYEKKITMAERHAAKLRLDFQEQEKNRIRLVDEVRHTCSFSTSAGHES